MKTSKILFISFFALLGAVLLLFAFPASQQSKEFYEMKAEYVVKSDTVPDFNYLLIENGCNVQLKDSESGVSYLSFSEHPDSVPTMADFSLKGDTLIVNSTRNGSGNWMTLFAHVPQSYVVKGRLKIENTQEAIVAHVQGGRLEIRSSANTQLEVVAINGKVEHYGKSIVVLDAHLEKSKLRIHESYLESARIKALSQSEIMLKRPGHLEMDRERSCKYYERD